jgi:pyruvate formate-lyase activating enzyme-like uncharacterized protein
MEYPKKIKSIHQIEITSRCNLACPYCVNKDLKRDKVDMDQGTFFQALCWARHFIEQGTQKELNLAGIGESTIHSKFVEYVSLARATVGSNVRLVIASNGLAITEEMAELLRPHNLRVYISMHRPEKAGPAMEILKRSKLLDGYSIDPALAAIDWAGQVDWFTSAEMTRCPFLEEGKVMVMSDGRITTCCLDGSGAGVIGHIREDVESLKIKPYSLCKQCHHIH